MRLALLCALASCLPETYESDRTVEWEPPAPSAREVIERFRSCMTSTGFATAGMWQWNGATTRDQGPCNFCHGASGLFAADDTVFLFTLRTSMETFLMLFAFDPAEDGSVVTNVPRLERAASGVNGHPTFFLEPQYLRITDDFVRLTYEHMADGTCTP